MLIFFEMHILAYVPSTEVVHSRTAFLIPLTHAPETGARKLASVSGASFSRQLQNFWRQKPTRTNKK